jgi:hypothetical protein
LAEDLVREFLVLRALTGRAQERRHGEASGPRNATVSPTAARCRADHQSDSASSARSATDPSMRAAKRRASSSRPS